MIPANQDEHQATVKIHRGWGEPQQNGKKDIRIIPRRQS